MIMTDVITPPSFRRDSVLPSHKMCPFVNTIEFICRRRRIRLLIRQLSWPFSQLHSLLF